ADPRWVWVHQGLSGGEVLPRRQALHDWGRDERDPAAGDRAAVAQRLMMSPRELAKLATAVENGAPLPADLPVGEGLIVGITGPAGAGKSSLASALVAEIR